jgi:hypothetical protein
MKFKIGTRVTNKREYGVGSQSKGEVFMGTIINYTTDAYVVEFDKNIGGHCGDQFSLNGIGGKKNHCWYLAEERLYPIAYIEMLEKLL